MLIDVDCFNIYVSSGSKLELEIIVRSINEPNQARVLLQLEE